MVHEQGIFQFEQWFIPALQIAGLIIAVIVVVSVVGSYLAAAARYGPTEGFYRVSKVLFSAFTSDLPGFSPRRTLAIAWLMIQESIRRRVLLTVFCVFVVLMIFGGWFLDPRTDNPGRIYLSFVLSATNLLVLVMSIFLSTLSLPNDIKNRTIYTIVTKPLRASEMVLGRILGFVAVGTFLLAIMGVGSYVFVVRGLIHTHSIDPETVQEVRSADGKLTGYKGRTTNNGGHDHPWEVPVGYLGKADKKNGHTHDVVRNEDGSFTVSPPRGVLEARVPIYGKLAWRDRAGLLAQSGVSVGAEWEYRKYVAGGTRSTATWKFSGLRKEQFPEGIPLEFTINVFRTYKGDINLPVLGSIQFRNPNTLKNKESAKFFHRFREYEVDYFNVPLKVKRMIDESRLTAGSRAQRLVEEYDLFDDLVEDGELEVVVRCEEAGQYYGMAQADCYIRGVDGTFAGNFAKCVLTEWLQMVMMVSYGVFFSTFLTGPVAFLGTISSLVVGWFMEFIREVVQGQFNPDDPLGYKGGGPVESIIRIMTQQNISTDLEAGERASWIIKNIDLGFGALIYATTYVVPDFTQFDTIAFVADGYNIFGAAMAKLILQATAYAVGTTVLAYFIFKTREIAK